MTHELHLDLAKLVTPNIYRYLKYTELQSPLHGCNEANVSKLLVKA